ncbi:glycosyltransferase family 1 protein [Agreia sp. VKM Ac-1783]|uniref:glycosyltransferase family 4 protein n=1 Tax=Agreia sp. VKM Ac-1783 TaxID=1938889 RepID=UPI000A2AE0A7|nr:glycosyltransferase family 1 protein [Agreia sp. VKM Ac-1783]SMQ60462.1 Glycosyltransferase involved in cell wall bisynthesis [Agreia sp. VKM Ac-1783]
MTTLRVIIDQMVGTVPGGIGRYAEELTRELIATAPRGCDVEGIVSKVPREMADSVTSRLPGLARLTTLGLPRRELSRAWQVGLATGARGRGMIHATSLLAPLRRIDRTNSLGEQVAVTIHDVVPWTHPETLTPHGVAWHKALARRARRYADAIVVPTHTVASELSEIMNFGDRIRVIGGAAGSRLVLPTDAEVRAAALELPDDFIVTVGTLEPRKGLGPLIKAMAHPDAPSFPLLIVGPPGWGDLDVAKLVSEAGLEPDRVRVMGFLSDSDLALVLDRASLFVFPSLAEGFGLPVVEAMHFGTPVVHSDAPALLEVTAGAGLAVARDDAAGYPERLAQAMTTALGDTELYERLSVAGYDRSHAFSWRDSAEKVWQLHADL